MTQCQMREPSKYKREAILLVANFPALLEKIIKLRLQVFKLFCI